MHLRKTHGDERQCPALGWYLDIAIVACAATRSLVRSCKGDDVDALAWRWCTMFGYTRLIVDSSEGGLMDLRSESTNNVADTLRTCARRAMNTCIAVVRFGRKVKAELCIPAASVSTSVWLQQRLC